MRFACFICALLLSFAPAHALVKVTTENVNQAIKYGIKNKAYGLSGVLGSNWIEGQDGSLLNIYSPFMLVATQASKKGIEGTTPDDINNARKRIARIISSVTDPHATQQVKFSVSLTGPSPDFAKQVKARIEGLGRGKSVSLMPSKIFYDQVADDAGQGSYEAINAYYFPFPDLENLENFQLILEGPGGEKVFRIDNQEIY